jgi:hypothetical protein
VGFLLHRGPSCVGTLRVSAGRPDLSPGRPGEVGSAGAGGGRAATESIRHVGHPESSGAQARHSRSEATGPVQEAPSLRSPRSAGRHLTRSVQCASERTPGIIDYDDQFFFAARVLQAIFGVAPFDQQPAPAAGLRQREVVEADQHPGGEGGNRRRRRSSPTPTAPRPVCVLGLQLGPLPR